MKLIRNMGPVDQVLRIAMGAALIYLGPASNILTTDPMSGFLMAAVGVYIIVSSAIGYCPFYHWAGFCTYKPKSDE